MTDSLPDPPTLDPAELAARSFGKARKGLDPAEVRAALGVAADALRTWQERDHRLTTQLSDMREALASADELSDERLEALLGDETVRVIQAARDAAAEIRGKAEAEAAQVAAETEQARAETEQLRAEVVQAAEAELESARQRGRQMVGEAREVRERMLRDLAERRRTARQQIEAAIAGRDRIVEALRLAGIAVDDVTGDLDELDSSARSAGERAAAYIYDDVDEVVAVVRGILDEGMPTELPASGGVRAVPLDLRGTSEIASPAGEDIPNNSLAVDIANDDVVIQLAAAGVAQGDDSSGEPADSDGADAELGSDEASDEVESVDEAESGDDAELDSAEPDDAEPDDVELDDTEPVSDAVDEDSNGDDELGDSADSPEESPVKVVETGAGSLTLAGIDELAAARRTVGTDAEVIDFTAAARRQNHQSGRLSDRFSAQQDDDLDDDFADELEEELADLYAIDEDDSDLSASEDDSSAEDRTADLVNISGEHQAVEVRGDDDAPALPESDVAATVHDLISRMRSGDPAKNAAPESATESATESDPESATESDPEPQGIITATATDESILDRRDVLLGPATKSLGRTFKRLLSDEQNEILDRLRRAKKKERPDVEMLLGSESEDVDAYVASLTADFRVAVEAGGRLWAELGDGVSPPLTTSDEPALVAALTARLTDVLLVRRARLIRVLEDADGAGIDVDELGERLRAGFREWRSASVDEAVGDLATTGFAVGASRAAGVGTTCRWIADHGGLPCADAEDNVLAGAHPCGDAFPTGDVIPPAHPGCRCVLVPSR